MKFLTYLVSINNRVKIDIFESAPNIFLKKVIYILPRLKRAPRVRRQTVKCKEEALNDGRGGTCSCDIVICIHSLTYGKEIKPRKKSSPKIMDNLALKKYSNKRFSVLILFL